MSITLIPRTIVLLLLLLSATRVCGQVPTQSFADFEKGAFDGWTMEGDGFGSSPASDKLYPGKIRGYGGSGFLCSLHPRKGNTATGKATSRQFTITKPLITFKIGGGEHPREACMNLVVNGVVVRTQTGEGFPQLLTRSWDVSEFEGKTAHFEVIDNTTSDQRGYILVDDIAFLGNDMPVTPPVSEDAPLIEIPLRVIHVLDSQGNAAFTDGSSDVLTAATAEKQVGAINEIFRSARIRFTFDPKEFETRRDDYLNYDFDIPVGTIDLKNRDAKPPRPGAAGHIAAFQAVADERADRLTVIVHHGSDWRWNTKNQEWVVGVGNSRGSPRLRDRTRGHFIRTCSTEARVWSHELGHAFGLPHTSRDSVDDPSKLISEEEISNACQEFVSKRGNQDHPEVAIDGDWYTGVRDTPPDPGMGFWRYSKDRSRFIQIRLAGREPITLFVSRDNIMAPTTGNSRFSNDQNRLMRRRAEDWKRKPSGVTPRPISVMP